MLSLRALGIREEVFVAAQIKPMAENLQYVPVSISVYSNEQEKENTARAPGSVRLQAV